MTTRIPPEPKRRFLRFTLRTLLLFMLVVCVLSGWIIERARKQWEVVAWVQQSGGAVLYFYEFAGNVPRTETWWTLLSRDFFEDVVAVHFPNSNKKQVKDVTPLAGLTSLTHLDVNGTQVSDVTPLAGLTSLKYLNLRGTQVTDVSPLAGLTSLELLLLCRTRVRDVTALSGLTSLEWLVLEDTQVSENAVENLKRALPRCKIRSGHANQ